MQAAAKIHGRGIHGTVTFTQTPAGVWVCADILGLPDGFHGFHIHAGGACRGDSSDPFSQADGHFNPCERPHPDHAGDLPPLLSCGGRARMGVLTDRFCLPALLGRTVIVHEGPDDFTSQPAGNAGAKIACGVITS